MSSFGGGKDSISAPLSYDHRERDGVPTIDNKSEKEQNAELHCYHIQEEVPMIVCANTIMDPRTVTREISEVIFSWRYGLLVVFCHAS